jgi:N-acetylneuraminic acid mutarotase
MKIFPKLLISAFIFLIYFPLVKAQKTDWIRVETKNKIQGRSECSLVALNNKLYLIGGDGPAMPVEEYDPKTMEWTRKAVSPVPLHHFQAVQHDNKIYVLDAFYEGNFPDQEPAPHVYCYNTLTDKWIALKGLAAERRRAGAGAAVFNGKLYLVNGITHGHNRGTNNYFDEFDPKTDTWTILPNAPHIRDHSMAVVVKNKLYVVGGRNTSFKDPNNPMGFFSQVVLDVDCFDFKTQKWTTLAAKLPLGTGGGTAVAIHGIIYYIGGERATDTKPNAPQKDVYFLDPERSNSWRKGPSLNIARNGVGGAVIGDFIYIAGGAMGPGGPGVPGGPRPRRSLFGSAPARNGLVRDTAPHQERNPPGIPPPTGPLPSDLGIVLEMLEVK